MHWLMAAAVVAGMAADRLALLPAAPAAALAATAATGLAAAPATQARLPAMELPGPAAVAVAEDIRHQITVEMELTAANSTSATGQAVAAVVVAAATAPPRGAAGQAAVTGVVEAAAGIRRMVPPGRWAALAGTVS
jgi:hypothetical protein